MSALTVEREQSKRPVGHEGPVRFSFTITVAGPIDREPGSNQTGRARRLAHADAEVWCAEMRAPELVFQFEKVDDGWTEQGMFSYAAYFGTGLMLERGPGE